MPIQQCLFPVNTATPWHRASYERFLRTRLPQLLAEHMPLAGYHVEPAGDYLCRLMLTVSLPAGDVDLAEMTLPQPDEQGVFQIEGESKVVVPIASQPELELATISCVGDQLYDYVAGRLGSLRSDILWRQVSDSLLRTQASDSDATDPGPQDLVRAWLPLEAWTSEFLHSNAQRLDTTNWLSRYTHLRRILIAGQPEPIKPGQMGRVCPFETPEGPNLGRVFTVAVGAEIRDGKLVILDERPQATLGLSASMIPFLEHNDPNRLLMGANMLRQVLVSPDPEPAWVQTGNEPDAPDFWCGRNLLTAFISMGADTYGDGIVVGESAARRLNYPQPLEPGDKLANRHGTKGVVSRILPDAEMPHLANGMPVDLVFNSMGLHVRMNFGQLREALLASVARAEGKPALAPPFEAPTAATLAARLVGAGLPESGMQTLTLGLNGTRLEQPSLAGWVYWNRLAHIAAGKARVSVDPNQGQVFDDIENQILLDLGALETVAENVNTRSARRPDAQTLAARLAAGAVEQAGPPAPMFTDMVERLRAAGIRAELTGDRVTFRLEPPAGAALSLAQPIPHPWLSDHTLTAIGHYIPTLRGRTGAARGSVAPDWVAGSAPESEPESYAALVEANDRLARMVAHQAPAPLVDDARRRLAEHVRQYLAYLIEPAHLLFTETQLFSGRAVIAPGAHLQAGQVALSEELAWVLFGPLVTRALGRSEPDHERTGEPLRLLDEIMARSWLIVHPAPALTSASFLALRPIRDPGHVVRLHPLAAQFLNADFDGDQVAFYLPITEAAQHEAGERLTLAAHLARDPGLMRSLLPSDALWGLARLSLTLEGRSELAQDLGEAALSDDGPITEWALDNSLVHVLTSAGAGTALALLERLTERGFAVAQASGASLSPFAGQGRPWLPEPKGEEPALWELYKEQVAEKILSRTDFDDPQLGPQLLAAHSRARGRRHLVQLVGLVGAVEDAAGRTVVVRHGCAHGLMPQEMLACVAGARRGLAAVWARWDQVAGDLRTRSHPEPFTVLARARRSAHPGVVFARAAATGEFDPLVDVVSRLMAGLPPKAK